MTAFLSSVVGLVSAIPWLTIISIMIGCASVTLGYKRYILEVKKYKLSLIESNKENTEDA